MNITYCLCLVLADCPAMLPSSLSFPTNIKKHIKLLKQFITLINLFQPPFLLPMHTVYTQVIISIRFFHCSPMKLFWMMLALHGDFCAWSVPQDRAATKVHSIAASFLLHYQMDSNIKGHCFHLHKPSQLFSLYDGQAVHCHRGSLCLLSQSISGYKFFKV